MMTSALAVNGKDFGFSRSFQPFDVFVRLAAEI